MTPEQWSALLPHAVKKYLRVLDDSNRNESGCLEWSGATMKNGYSMVHVGSRLDGTETRLYLHRLSIMLRDGLIPRGLDVDHLCRNPACHAYAHLEVVTHAENMARSGPATSPTCVRGHQYDERNTYRDSDGYRRCRACARQYQKNRRMQAQALNPEWV